MIIDNLPIDVEERRKIFADFWDLPWREDRAAIVRYALLHDPDIDICRWCPQILCAWGDRSVETRHTLLTYLQQLFFETAVMSEVLTAVAELEFADNEIVDAIASHIGSTQYCIPLAVIDALYSLNHPTTKALDALEWATTISSGYYADDLIRSSAAETLIKLRSR